MALVVDQSHDYFYRNVSLEWFYFFPRNERVTIRVFGRFLSREGVCTQIVLVV